MEYSMNIPKKIGKQSKYRKFWNIEYWNIPKKSKTTRGGINFKQARHSTKVSSVQLMQSSADGGHEKC